MDNIVLLSSAALLCGATIAMQASTNATLLQHMGQVIWVAIILFAIGLTYLLLIATATHTAPPNLSALLNAPLWSFSGGIIVASYVLIITFLVPKLGVANAIFFIVFGQMLASVTIDHFGFFSAPIHLIDGKRALGVALMAAGVYFVRR